MPSVMDTIRFRTSFDKLGRVGRQRFITDTLKWLNDEGYTGLEGGHAFATELQKVANVDTVPQLWYTALFQTYSRYLFIDKFLRRLK